ncbi:CesT family type III secretion system chaperone [Acanthopleuribacter pedis]|uniref:Type III secretion system chaperone n=1 Tax=Acanthopleuribacter pedis TaxID=442870 RepID=A0A8J7U3S7_9BACT|nr:CesT family type III secretion system chaperone [Acanthopleuribacter pedis]MBO1317336.1 type III secretion system chaperone [Acanthopleuribacter pedis]MBO1318643.1 type III secretion system chaperone [Acanthopleuribacter pedis]
MSHGQEQVNHWLAQLGQTIGCGLALNEEGRCSLKAAGDVGIDIFCEPEDTQFYLSLPLFTLSGLNSREMVLQHALTMNMFQQDTGGASIALDADGEALLLCYTHPVEGTEYQTFYNILANMIESCMELKSQLIESDDRDDEDHHETDEVSFGVEQHRHAVPASSTRHVTEVSPHETLRYVMNFA